MTRSAFILRGALAASAAYGAGALGPFVERALAQGGESDGDILRIGLTIELLQADFYGRATQLPLSPGVAALAQRFSGEEQEHVKRVKNALDQQGAASASELNLRFRFNMNTEADFLRIGVQLADIGVAFYNGAGEFIHSPEIVLSVAQIVQVEARHAAALRLERDQNPAPDAFDKGATLEDSFASTVPYIERL